MYQYLNNLKIDLENLKNQISLIPEELWHYWVNPRGKVVKNYKHVYLKDTNINLNLILDQLKIEHGLVEFLRYDPFSRLHPHTDWEFKSAILFGISDNSNIEFWQNGNKIVVPYIAPILANLQTSHSVENNVSDFRYLLKIPFKADYKTVLQEINNLIY
jgi:hypothetical protein